MEANSQIADQDLLRKIREILEDLYGLRLDGVVLFGSRARGDGDEGSDIDLLVLLNGPVDFGSEVRAIVDALYDLQLDGDVTIEALPASTASFEARRWPLYQTAGDEGLRL